MVYEDTCEAVADSLVEQHGGNRRVYTAAEAEHHFVVAELLAKLCNCAFDEALSAP